MRREQDGRCADCSNDEAGVWQFHQWLATGDGAGDRRRTKGVDRATVGTMAKVARDDEGEG